MLKLYEISDDEWVFEDNLIDLSADEQLDNAMDHYHSGMLDTAEKLLREILEKNHHHIDTYHHLSLVYEKSELDFEAYLCCREAVRIGLAAMPENFSWKASKLEWSHLSNRPFLRAYHNLGLWLEKRNETSEAIVVYGNILSVCPNDNIGVRYMLPKLWLESGDLLSIIRLSKLYAGDYSPELMYAYPLALILIGEAEKAKALLDEAKTAFPLVAKELKKKRHPKPKLRIEGAITMGGKDQAYEYWKQYGKYWENSEEAMRAI